MQRKNELILLRVARDCIEAAVHKRPVPEITSDDPELNEHCGCFVTIKNVDRLRGCIGQFTSNKPLLSLVSDMAVAAATKDPRFLLDPILPQELEFLDIEISVLSTLKESKEPQNLRLGIDGVYIVKGHRSGCFLPQVATEMGWTEQQFLTYCCVQKAHLPPDAWKDPDAKVYLFTADAFSAKLRDL